MRKYCLNILCWLVLSASALATSTAAAQSAPTQRPRGDAPELAALSALPASDAVMVINLHRLLTEALPRLLPPDSAKETDAYLSVMQTFLGIDVRQINTIAVGFKQPQAISARIATPSTIIVQGNFSSGKMIEDFRRLFIQNYQGHVRDEQYKGRNISIFNVEDLLGAPISPVLKTTIELSLTALDPDMIAIGTVANIQRTIDAREGYERISPALIQLATFKPGAIISFASISPEKTAPRIISASAQDSGQLIEILNTITEVSAALEMKEAGLELSILARTEHADQAATLRDALMSLLHQLSAMVKDTRLKKVLDSSEVKMQSNEVDATALLPQEAIASYIHDLQLLSTPPGLDVSMATPRVRRPAPSGRARKGRHTTRH